jgi:uncharacterized protein YoaH (UPF0181 family)
MNYFKEFINDILTEVSYRTREGIVNLKNREHLAILSEVLDEMELWEIKGELFENLLEAEANSKTDDLYKNIGGTGYVLAKDYEKWEKNPDAYTGDKFTKKDGQYIKQGEGDTTQTKTGQELGPEDFDHDPTSKNTTKPKTTSPQQEQEKLSKEDSEKVKKQILMTKAEAKKQQKGVGLGTPESRTGESVTVYAGQKIQQLMSEGKSYKDARAEIEQELLEIAKDDKSVLTRAWVKSGLAVFDHLDAVYGFKNIKHFAWDTPQGNKLVGSEGHGTSADMFVQLEDGSTVGVSLKKDFKVFIVNGGYGKAMGEFEQKTGIKLPENCQVNYYNDRRQSEFDNSIEIIDGDRGLFETQAKVVLEDEEEFNKTFGPKKDAIRSRKAYIASRKLGISVDQAKKLSDEEIDKAVKDTTPEEFVSILKEIKTGDDMKFAAAFFKRKEIENKHGIYGRLRGLDNEMTENIFNSFQANDTMREKTKEKIIEDTHIIDTLFPKEPLGDFKTVFGTDPAVEMTRDAIQSIFGIGDLYSQYQNATNDEEKEKLRKEIENKIKDKLKITKKRGVPVIAIMVENEDGTTSELPLYTIGVRTRGIGNAQTLEVSQAVFGSLALKNGNTDVNSWDDKDRRTVVDGEVNDILSKFEDDKNPDIDELTLEEQEELKERIKLLESYNSNSKKLQALKKSLGID